MPSVSRAATGLWATAMSTGVPAAFRVAERGGERGRPAVRSAASPAAAAERSGVNCGSPMPAIRSPADRDRPAVVEDVDVLAAGQIVAGWSRESWLPRTQT